MKITLSHDRTALMSDRGNTIKYRRLREGVAIALIRPAGSNEIVWRYRNWGYDLDVPYGKAESLDDFYDFLIRAAVE